MKDDLGVIAIFVTVITALLSGFSMFLFHLSGKRNRQRVEEINEIRSSIEGNTNNVKNLFEYSDDFVAIITGITRELDNRLTATESALIKISRRKNGDEVIDALIDSSNDSRRVSEKMLLELQLYSNDPNMRLSSYFQLSEEFGNASSLIKMQKLSPRNSGEKETLDKCIAHLWRKLEK